jgi:hypothetical protein
LYVLPSSGNQVQLRSPATDGGVQPCHANADLRPGASLRNWHIVWTGVEFVATTSPADVWGPAPPIVFPDPALEASVVIGNITSSPTDVAVALVMSLVLTEFLEALATM